MISQKTEIQITPDARSLLGGLLRSTEGQSILDALTALCPRIALSGTAEDQLATAHRHAGWEACVEQLLEFGRPEEKPAGEKSSQYPSLDEDAEWEKTDHSNQN